MIEKVRPENFQITKVAISRLVRIVAPNGSTEPAPARPGRERLALGLYVIAALATTLLLHHTSQQPHTNPPAGEEGPVSTARLTPQQATADFPAADIATLADLTGQISAAVQAGDQATAATRATDLETAWDTDQARLEPMNETAWTFIDTEIDQVLSSVRSATADRSAEQQALCALQTTLG